VTDIVSIPRTDIVQVEFLTQAEAVVRDVVENKNFEAGFQFINDLHAQGRAFDDAIGMMLNGMNDAWNPAEHDGERFEQATLRRTGLKPVTVQRHLKIQKALPVIPEEYREEIQDMGFKAKIRVAQLVEGGYEMTDKDWHNIARAPDEKEVDRIAREIKGVEPRSNWLSISIDANGVLRVHTVRGVQEIGRLDTWNDDSDVKKAISRLLGCTGVQPASEY
jgi:hypothetical protein